jgi:hypothetical protein
MWSAQDDKPLPRPRLFVFPGDETETEFERIGGVAVDA